MDLDTRSISSWIQLYIATAKKKREGLKQRRFHLLQPNMTRPEHDYNEGEGQQATRS